MNIHDAIRSRRSIRRYKEGEKIPREHLNQIVEAAMYAPSACNTRPWEFVVVENPEILKQLQQVHPYTSMLSTASAAIIVCALPEKQNNNKCADFYPQDCGAATQNILLEALALGYGTCWCGVYPKEELMQSISKIIGGHIPFNLIAIGVPNEEPVCRGHFDEEKITFL